MYILPAIDLYDGKAVRLYKGDYSQMTVYSDDPVSLSLEFKEAGAEFVHIVDLEGARDGNTHNFEIIKEIIQKSGLKIEIGGGIRTENDVRRYIEAGAARIILGTAAVTNTDFLIKIVDKYREKTAVGVDIKDGFAAIKGWKEKSDITAEAMFKKLETIGVKTVICTDISKDGAMSGTNVQMYKEFSQKFDINIIASGGISDMDSIKAIKELGIYGAIIGKAYYTGTIDLKKALEVGR